MPVGNLERGWKDEVGACVYSSRESKIVKVYPVKTASAEEAAETLNDYLSTAVPYLNEKPTHVQMDPGSQFISKEWSEKCTKLRIRNRYCPVDHQAMNGQVERVQGLLARKVRALLASGNLHTKYWPLALQTAAYLLNRTPHTSIGGRTPLEAATGSIPNLENARIFGCAAYVQIPKVLRKGKFAETAWRGIMIGYSTNSPEWLILNPRTNKIRKAYSVRFNEHERGFKDEIEYEKAREFDVKASGDYLTDVTEETQPILMRPPEETNSLDETNEAPTSPANEDGDLEDVAPAAQSQMSGAKDYSEVSSDDMVNDSSWEGDSDDEDCKQMGQCPRRGTRIRHRFDPNRMPSGTLEMARLTCQVEADSSDEEVKSQLEEPDLCLVAQTVT